MHQKGVAVSIFFVLVFLLVISTTSAFWPFSSSKQTIGTGYAVSGTNGASLSSIEGPSSGAAGTSVTVSITATNTGKSTWGSDHNIVLKDSSHSPIQMASADGVAPGSSKTATFTIQLPASGTVNYYVQVIEHNVEWFGPEQSKNIVVSAGQSSVSLNGECDSTRACGSIVVGTDSVQLSCMDTNGDGIGACKVPNGGLCYTSAVPCFNGLTCQDSNGDGIGKCAALATNSPVVSGTNDATLEVSSSSTSAVMGSTVSFAVSAKNTGTKNWGANHYISMQDALHNVIQTVSLNGITSGNTKTGTFTVRLPDRPGPYTYYFQVFEHNVGFFGPEQSKTFTLTDPTATTSPTRSQLGEECDIIDVLQKRLCADGLKCQGSSSTARVGTCVTASAPQIPQVTPECGNARNLGVNDYSSSATQTGGRLCAAGIPQTASGATIWNNDQGLVFNAATNSVSWKCVGSTTIICAATRPAGNTNTNSSTTPPAVSPTQPILPSNYITDISARGYVGEGNMNLILGFKASNTANFTATVDPSWTDSQALLPEQVTTNLHDVTSGNILHDGNSASYAVTSSIIPGTYGLVATSPGNGGQSVLATTGSNVIFSQFSVRGYVNVNTPLILGFTVKGSRVNLDIQAHPEKLPAEFTPKLADFTYDIILYKGSEKLYTSQNTIGPQLSEGKYTIVVQPKESASGYMLLEVSNADSSSIVTTNTQNNNVADIPGSSLNAGSSNANTASGTTGQANAVVCTSGCLSSNGQICHIEGYRSNDGKYCDPARSKNLLSQKNTDSQCSNNWECSSNFCLESKCASKGFLESLLEIFRRFLGSG